MERAPCAGGECSSRQRLGAAVTLALTVHAAAAFALPMPYPLRTEPTRAEASPLETVWLDVHSAAGNGGLPAVLAPAEASTGAMPRARPAKPKSSAAAPHTTPADEQNLTALRLAQQASALHEGARDLASPNRPGEGASPTAQGSADNSGGLASGAETKESGSSGMHGTRGGARLLSAGDPCSGYFPEAATVARGQVRLAVDVDARGFVTGSDVLEGSARGSGFAQAARSCAARLQFAPARTGEGNPVPSRVTLLLHFARP